MKNEISTLQIITLSKNYYLRTLKMNRNSQVVDASSVMRPLDNAARGVGVDR